MSAKYSERSPATARELTATDDHNGANNQKTQQPPPAPPPEHTDRHPPQHIPIATQQPLHPATNLLLLLLLQSFLRVRTLSVKWEQNAAQDKYEMQVTYG